MTSPRRPQAAAEGRNRRALATAVSMAGCGSQGSLSGVSRVRREKTSERRPHGPQPSPFVNNRPLLSQHCAANQENKTFIDHPNKRPASVSDPSLALISHVVAGMCDRLSRLTSCRTLLY
ncbi:hypothetical protein DPEC_G00137730 [Dallia pectoralis]|uniref:Uncharacterized protein n=1 Tax=Dallia pectoralis TaxID=75939 RepID=A0ACC2GLU4_DALPE|nr:hypothetical protein DPEC_G00137730 [Dallia pectoralis]